MLGIGTVISIGGAAPERLFGGSAPQRLFGRAAFHHVVV